MINVNVVVVLFSFFFFIWLFLEQVITVRALAVCDPECHLLVLNNMHILDNSLAPHLRHHSSTYFVLGRFLT